MNPRAEELITTLGLVPHPEGGYFREVFRAPATVEPTDGRGTRSALTTIYFLLPAGSVSRWHRVKSAEVWHHYEGAPLELLRLATEAVGIERVRLGPHGPSQSPVYCVPAGEWQAARSLGDYTLAGCTVGPGFEYADFQLLADLPDVPGRLARAGPDAERFI